MSSSWAGPLQITRRSSAAAATDPAPALISATLPLHLGNKVLPVVAGLHVIGSRRARTVQLAPSMMPLQWALALTLLTACYPRDAYWNNTMPEPTPVYGPPGGEIDPAWQASEGPAYPDGYDASGYVEPSSDPSDPGYVMGAVNDGEIDATLDGYGEWVEVEGYGRVWRPYATNVGVDFTPYESCGTWVWTDWGWTFACDWQWGWLAFHYGRWGWFDDYWAWQPGYEWSPAWVEWRGGGGYVGWRPLGPSVRDHRGQVASGPSVRDHRGTSRGGSSLRDHRTAAGRGPSIRDHRTATAMDSHWRFSADRDFGKRIRPNLYKVPAEGLRVTSIVTRPPVRPNYQPVRAASIMRGRLAHAHNMNVRGPTSITPDSSGPRRGGRGGVSYDPGSSRGRPAYDPSRGPGSSGSPPIYQPTYPTYQPPGRSPGSGSSDGRGSTFEPPDRAAVQPGRSRPVIEDRPTRPDRAAPPWGDSGPQPTHHGGRGAWERGTRPSFDAPSANGPRYSPPSRPSSSSSGGNWQPPPSRAPSSSTYAPPSRPSSSSSSGNWSSPSRSSSSSSGSSRSSSSGSSWGGGSSRSSGSGGGGGGGSSRGGGGGASSGGGGGRRR